jgi:hypothetical protein
VATFLVELYVPRLGAARLSEAARRLCVVAAELRSEGVRVRYLRSLAVPGDELCFHLVESSSADAVAELSRRAALSGVRIVEALG